MSPERLMNGLGGMGAVIVVCAISNIGVISSQIITLHATMSSNLVHMFCMSKII